MCCGTGTVYTITNLILVIDVVKGTKEETEVEEYEKAKFDTKSVVFLCNR